MRMQSPDWAFREIARALHSPNEADSNGEMANVVDGLFAIARGLHDIADAQRRTTAVFAMQVAELERQTELIREAGAPPAPEPTP